jgi:hypothetical protein
MTYSLINTSSLPGDNMDPAGIDAAARNIRSVGAKVAHQGAVTLHTWQGLSASYHAPEQGTLFTAMNPAKATAETFGTEMGTAATALETFAEEVRTIKTAVAAIKTEADAFVDKINANGGMVPGNGGAGYNPYATNGGATLDVHWYEDAATVNANNALRDRIDQQQEALWAAERKCANAIGAIYCAAPIGPITSQSNGVGYGVDDIPDDAQMPWGAAVKRKESCAEKAVNGVVVDGLVGGMILPLTGFAGFNISIENGYQGWSLGNIGNSFVGLGNFAIGGFATSPLGLPLLAMPGAAGDFFRDRAKSATYGVIGLVGIDMYAKDPLHKWKDDPWRTGGSSVFNVGSLFVPGAAAGKAGKVAEVGTDAARVSEVAADAGKASLAAKASKAAELATDALESSKGITAETFNKLFKGSDLDGAIRFGNDLDVDLPTTSRGDIDLGNTNTGLHDQPDVPPVRDETTHQGAPHSSGPTQPAADHSTGSHPGADPASEHPAAQQPTAQHPTAQHPTAQHPTAEHPSAGDTNTTPQTDHGSDHPSQTPEHAGADDQHAAGHDHTDPAHQPDPSAIKENPGSHQISPAGQASFAKELTERNQLASQHTVALHERNLIADRLGVDHKDLTVRRIGTTVADLRQEGAAPSDIRDLRASVRAERELRVRLIDASERVGMYAGEDVITSHGGSVIIGDAAVKGHSGELDLAGISQDHSTLTMVEAKGGDSASLGWRTVDGVRVRQGSTVYLNDLIHRDVRLRDYLEAHPQFAQDLADNKVKVEYKLVNGRTDGTVRTYDFRLDSRDLHLTDLAPHHVGTTR